MEVDKDIYQDLEKILDKITLKDGKIRWEIIAPISRMMQSERNRWNNRIKVLEARIRVAEHVLNGADI